MEEVKLSITEKWEKARQQGMTLSAITVPKGNGSNYATSTISEVLNGKYTGSSKDIEQKVEAVLDAFLEHIPTAKAAGFLTFKQQLIYADLLDELRSERGYKLIVGESGVGKTEIMKAFVKQHPAESAYVKMERGLSLSSFIDLILESVGAEVRSGNAFRRTRRLYDELKRQGKRILIFDEMDLCDRDSPETFDKKFEILRELYNRDFIVYVVGLPILEELFRRNINSKYYTSRIDDFQRMQVYRKESSANRGAKQNELKAYWEQVLEMPMNPIAAALIASAHQNGYMRTLKNVQQQYKKLSDIDDDEKRLIAAKQRVFNLN